MVAPLNAGLDNPAAGSSGAGPASKGLFDYNNRILGCQTCKSNVRTVFGLFRRTFTANYSARHTPA